MENEEPLLSICIPTYNRCEYLEEGLLKIISDPSFDERVEIVISDNASKDQTEQMCKKYANKYPNILYYRNDVNLVCENFYLVLSKANGRYAKLFNDTLRFKEGALGKILNTISNNNKNKSVMFFQNIPFLNSNCKKQFFNTNQFVRETSFLTTWIGNFGIWKEQLYLLNSHDSLDKYLLQVDWYLQLVSKSKYGVIYFDDYFTSSIPKKKDGYNYFEVFIRGYLNILKFYSDKNNISIWRYQLEKYRLFKHHILTSIFYLFIIKDKTYNFDTTGSYAIIIKYYWYYPYTYFTPIFTLIQKISKIKSICLSRNKR